MATMSCSNGPTVGGLLNALTSTSAAASCTASSSSQQFLLKWNNHTTNLVKTFTEMVFDDHFVDVTLACDGSSIKAHKLVLSACSNYFKELFIANPCRHPIVILKDMKFEDLKAIIDFMYKGEVNVSQNQLGALLKTAEVLRVKGLTEVNEGVEKNSGESASGSTVVGINPTEESAAPVVTSVAKSTLPVKKTIPSEIASSTVSTGRKKRRRRSRRPGGSQCSFDGISGSESGSSSEEETIDIGPTKRPAKDVTQPSQTALPAVTEEALSTPSNVIQSRRRVLASQQQLQSVQREHVSGDGSAGDNDTNDGSESWSHGGHLPPRLLPPGDGDDESDEMIDVKPIISFDEGSPGTPPLSNAMALTQDQMRMEQLNQMDDGSNQGTPGSGKICVCHLCHLTFTAYSSLRRHMARHYADRERYECDICFKSYSRKDYLKEHKKLKHSIN